MTAQKYFSEPPLTDWPFGTTWSHGPNHLAHKAAALAAPAHGSNFVRHAPHAKAAQYRRASAQATKPGNKREALDLDTAGQLQLHIAPARMTGHRVQPLSTSATRQATAATADQPATADTTATAHRHNGGMGERTHCVRHAAHRRSSPHITQPTTRIIISPNVRGCVSNPTRADGHRDAASWCVATAHQFGGLARRSIKFNDISVLTCSVRQVPVRNGARYQHFAPESCGFRCDAPRIQARGDWANPPGRRERRRVPLIPERLKTGTSLDGLFGCSGDVGAAAVESLPIAGGSKIGTSRWRRS